MHLKINCRHYHRIKTPFGKKTVYSVSQSATVHVNIKEGKVNGHVVLGRDLMLLEMTRPHERVHVRQCERWGIFFLPAYGIASLIALARGGSMYRDNGFEREAYGDKA